MNMSIIPPIYVDADYFPEIEADPRLAGVVYQHELLPSGKMAIRAADGAGQAKIKLLHGGNISA
ncbi:hypothetical protein [Sphingomonas fuzhouensis]|nr:hypothetical protein [Sphingomonas sp. SGZ-02]